MGFKALDNVLLQQAVITGVITDALSGDALTGMPTVKLAWRIAGATGYVDCPAPARIKPGARFMFSGAPQTFFPALAAGQSLECRLTAEAQGYQPQVALFTLSRSQVTPQQLSRTYAGEAVRLWALDNLPLHQQAFALQPDPVSLAGRVIEDNDMESPLEGALVSVVSPAGGSAVTDTSGYFRIDALPVVERVTVEITLDGATTSAEVLLDYERPINERTFSLSA